MNQKNKIEKGAKDFAERFGGVMEELAEEETANQKDTIEKHLQPFRDEYEEVGSRLSNEDYWDVLRVARIALTQAHQDGIREALAEVEKWVEDIPEAYGWGEKDREADRGYQICSKNVKAQFKKNIKTTLQSKLK